MTQATLETWARRLRAVASRTLGDDLGAGDWHPDRLARFSDERGHRRAVDPYVLAWRGRADSVRTPPAPTGISEAHLWSALTHDGVRAHDALGQRASSSAHAPLFEQPDDVVIEVWTETELASLHALWWLARQDGSLADVVRSAATWHVERVQPDNATNHAWALHVFLLLDVEGADLYAQTLLHNCMVHTGQPDRLSAHLLADSADALDAV